MTLSTTKDLQTENDNTGFLKLTHEVHEKLLDVLDYDELNCYQGDLEATRSYLGKEILKLLSTMQVPEDANSNNRLVDAVLDEVLGFGPVEELLRDNTVTDIFINAPNKIFVERRGRVEKASIRFLDDEHIYRLVQRLASKSGRHLDLGTPYFDAQLPDGSRLHAIIPPVAIDGIKVSIRKFLFQAAW